MIIWRCLWRSLTALPPPISKPQAGLGAEEEKRTFFVFNSKAVNKSRANVRPRWQNGGTDFSCSLRLRCFPQQAHPTQSGSGWVQVIDSPLGSGNQVLEKGVKQGNETMWWLGEDSRRKIFPQGWLRIGHMRWSRQPGRKDTNTTSVCEDKSKRVKVPLPSPWTALDSFCFGRYGAYLRYRLVLCILCVCLATKQQGCLIIFHLCFHY